MRKLISRERLRRLATRAAWYWLRQLAVIDGVDTVASSWMGYVTVSRTDDVGYVATAEPEYHTGTLKAQSVFQSNVVYDCTVMSLTGSQSGVNVTIKFPEIISAKRLKYQYCVPRLVNPNQVENQTEIYKRTFSQTAQHTPRPLKRHVGCDWHEKPGKKSASARLQISFEENRCTQSSPFELPRALFGAKNLVRTPRQDQAPFNSKERSRNVNA